ncbi:hypothetical protein Trydic_g11638 [Trypoxylus dichotomus]
MPDGSVQDSAWSEQQTPLSGSAWDTTSFRYNVKHLDVGIDTQKSEKDKKEVIDNYIKIEVMEEAPLHLNQHAHWAGRFAETTLLELTGTIQKTLDEEETAICAFLDVSVGEQAAKIRTTRGIPQGAGFLPLMWSLAVELPNRLIAFGVHCIGYADDIAIIAKGKLEEILCKPTQMSLRITNEWYQSVKLGTNAANTTIVPFTRKRKISNMKDIRLDRTLIEYKSEVKHLGTTLDKKLLSNRHITLTTNKATRALVICRNLAGKTWGCQPNMAMTIHQYSKTYSNIRDDNLVSEGRTSYDQEYP